MRRIMSSFAVFALAACGAPKEPAAPAADATAPVAVADAAPAAFAQCKVCHSTEVGGAGVGPSLAGLAGRKAGTLAGFAYSTAMKDSGLTWDDATLDQFITAPTRKVPGTRMAYAGQTDPAKRAEIIAYLKTLK